jgi:hypothetical protein
MVIIWRSRFRWEFHFKPLKKSSPLLNFSMHSGIKKHENRDPFFDRQSGVVGRRITTDNFCGGIEGRKLEAGTRRMVKGIRSNVPQQGLKIFAVLIECAKRLNLFTCFAITGIVLDCAVERLSHPKTPHLSATVRFQSGGFETSTSLACDARFTRAARFTRVARFTLATRRDIALSRRLCFFE